MNRSQLCNMIESGRAVASDCYAIGKSIPDGDSIGQLFQNDILNKSVILKRYEKAPPSVEQPVRVNTLIYFPYDFDNAYDGGESLDFGDAGFQSALAFKISKGDPTTELLERIGEDMKILHLLDSMHSLDPFLFKSKAEQADMEEGIHPEYFAISDQEWDAIRLPIRDKISKLVDMALGESKGGTAEKLAREQYVERFLTKIWQAKDVEGIEPFIKAMQIAPERAPEVFFAWKAVCYYEVRFDLLQEELKALFQWVGHNQLCYPVNHIVLTPEEQSKIKDRRNSLRENMRDGYIMARKVIDEYERSYDQFVLEDKPQMFLSFLENAENSYLGLAARVSGATHSGLARV